MFALTDPGGPPRMGPPGAAPGDEAAEALGLPGDAYEHVLSFCGGGALLTLLRARGFRRLSALSLTRHR